MKKVFLSLITIFMVLTLSVVLVKANTTTVVTLEDGVQIRTDGNNGLKWVANVTNHKDSNEYGFFFVQGDKESVTVNTSGVIKQVVEGVTSEEPVMQATMVKFPKASANQDISVVAYAYDGQTYTYSNVVVRNLAEVALAAKKANIDGLFIDDIVDYVAENFKSVYVGFDKAVNLSSAIYEINPKNLENEFVSDWNNLFGTTWTSFDYTAFNKSAIDGTNPLTADSDTNCSGTNAYVFFNSNPTTSAKWKWLLNFFIGETKTNIHPTVQINAILGNGSYELVTEEGASFTKLYQFKHLSRSLQNFFKANGENLSDYPSISFEDSCVYAQIGKYNNVILATSPVLVQENSTLNLDVLTKNGYDFNGYVFGENTPTTSYVVSNENVSLVPSFNTINYSISFMNGQDEFTNFAKTYTVESTVFLPTPEVNGYDFLGWYEEEDFSGDAVSVIEKGTVGDKTYYGKFVKQDYAKSNVTYDLNGGYFRYSSLDAAIADFIADFNAYVGQSYTAQTFFALGSWSEVSTTSQFFYGENKAGTSITDTARREKWSWLIEYLATVANSANTKALENFKNYNTTAELKTLVSDAQYRIAYEVRAWVGQQQYTTNANVPTANYGSSEIKSLSTAAALGETNTQLQTPCTLPTPSTTKTGVKFGGWKSSLDGSIVTTYPGYTESKNITYTAQWISSADVDANVTFDYNGGATDALYLSQGTNLTTLVVSRYNKTDFWNSTTTPYLNNVFVNSSSSDPAAKFSTRIYIAKDNTTGLFKVVDIQLSGTASSWPTDADLVITISGQYNGTYDDNFDVSKIKAGDVLFTDKAITTATESNLVTISFYSSTISNDIVTERINSSSVLPTPYKAGYAFGGWYDANGNLYELAGDFAGVSGITVTAKWVIDDRIVGSFENNSWVVVGSTIKLNYEFVGGSNLAVEWSSTTPTIAEVDQNGQVTGLKEGLATIVVNVKGSKNISFTYYVTVVTESSGMLKVLLESNNEEIFIRNDLGIGAGTPAYYYDAIGSVSKLLFENYVEHKDFYLSSPSNKTTLTGAGTGGVDFITVHYAADMPYSANYSLRGGYNLASMNKTYNSNGTGASWNYSVGNDGVWYCQNVAYGSWHAGSSKSMTWKSSGVTTAQVGTNVYTTDVTLGSDGYFYIKGVKTTVKNTTGYTRLNTHGLGVKLSGSTWYLGGFYYNTSYKYISSTGGNNNSIGMETSVREGSDLWLTWQYTAQLCAKLLIQFNLPIQRLVGHHFFSGKDCPQPLIANNNEIWFVFRDMVAQQMAYFNAYGSAGASPTFSSNSTYLKSNGRVKSLPNYSECVTYTLTYKDGSSTKTVTLSSILPGTIA